MQNVRARDMFADDRPEGIAIGVFPPVKQPGHKVGDQPDCKDLEYKQGESYDCSSMKVATRLPESRAHNHTSRDAAEGAPTPMRGCRSRGSVSPSDASGPAPFRRRLLAHARCFEHITFVLEFLHLLPRGSQEGLGVRRERGIAKRRHRRDLPLADLDSGPRDREPLVHANRVRGRPGIEDQALVVDVQPLNPIDRGEGRKKLGIDVGFRSMHGARISHGGALFPGGPRVATRCYPRAR